MSSVTSTPSLAQYIRKMRGGSQPILARASDGLLYVVKFSNNLQGRNLFFNESMGCALYRACQLPVPEWKPLRVTSTFLNRNPECWIETECGRLRPEAGLCYGSRYIGAETRILEILPGSSLGRVDNRASFWLAWLLDSCAAHADNRQALFVEDSLRRLSAVYIDHGHLFGGAKGEQKPSYLAARYLDSRIYPHVSLRYLAGVRRIAGSLDGESLWQMAGQLPSEWKTRSALKNFADFLERISDAKYLRNLTSAMAEANRRANQGDGTYSFSRPKPPGNVLYPGIPEVRWERFASGIRGAAGSCAVR